jgi:hypothetical protein
MSIGRREATFATLITCKAFLFPQKSVTYNPNTDMLEIVSLDRRDRDSYYRSKVMLEASAASELLDEFLKDEFKERMIRETMRRGRTL